MANKIVPQITINTKVLTRLHTTLASIDKAGFEAELEALLYEFEIAKGLSVVSVEDKLKFGTLAKRIKTLKYLIEKELPLPMQTELPTGDK